MRSFMLGWSIAATLAVILNIILQACGMSPAGAGAIVGAVLVWAIPACDRWVQRRREENDD